MLGWYDVTKTDTGIMFLLFMNCFGKTDGLCLGGMMWKKAAVDISDALIHITSPSFVRRWSLCCWKLLLVVRMSTSTSTPASTPTSTTTWCWCWCWCWWPLAVTPGVTHFGAYHCHFYKVTWCAWLVPKYEESHITWMVWHGYRHWLMLLLQKVAG